MTNFSNADLQEGLPEIDDFAGLHKRIDNFEKTLVIAHGARLLTLFFYAVCYAIRYARVEKNNQCNEFENDIGLN